MLRSPVQVFVDYVIDLEKKFKRLLNTKIEKTHEQKQEFKNCYYCKKSLYFQPEGPCEENGRTPKIIIDKIRDHDHYNRIYIYTGGHYFSCKLKIENVAVCKIVKTLNTIN